MSRIAYVNGRYLPHGEAVVHIEDRGYQFSDGIYEVIALRRGALVDEAPHLDRLERSLGELRIERPMGRRALSAVMREVARRNRVREGIVYIQVTRGVARRDHAFPVAPRPALVVTARSQGPSKTAPATGGVSVITVPDIRWARCDIKSVALLPNVLAKQQAREAGAFEAWFLDDRGQVTEGCSTNAWIVTDKGELITRDPGNAILNGVTRRTILRLAAERQIRLVERPFTLEEAKAAREVFITSTTAYVMPVVRIDDAPVGEGRAGPLSSALREAYFDYTIEGPGGGAAEDAA
ncbi:MAG: D-amino-acid transaminase [Rhodospirillaceae bacterium]|jgi:D-alanine transaminase|nr:D-amino-acid transaminase [Rhodospirillaceae bacterium]